MMLSTSATLLARALSQGLWLSTSSPACHAHFCIKRNCSATSSPYETITVTNEGQYSVVTLSRLKTMNSLSTQSMTELTSALKDLDHDSSVKSIILASSSTKAFAAGADIKEMSTMSFSEAYSKQLFKGWTDIQDVQKPIIAAVNGYALGGGFELALLCDIVVASEQAMFGLPEITLGVIPGIGGTQRLTRIVGRARAMDMILTGGRVSAAEALQMGIVSRVVAAEKLDEEVRGIAQRIAGFSPIALSKAKACIKAAWETPLQEGLRLERSEFWSCFALQDQKEGMSAFLEKRPPHFKGA